MKKILVVILFLVFALASCSTIDPGTTKNGPWDVTPGDGEDYEGVFYGG